MHYTADYLHAFLAPFHLLPTYVSFTALHGHSRGLLSPTLCDAAGQDITTSLAS